MLLIQISKPIAVSYYALICVAFIIFCWFFLGLSSTLTGNIHDTILGVSTRDNGPEIYITKEVIEELNQEYEKSETEYYYCLLGETTENKITVTDLIEPETIIRYESGIFHNNSKPCSEEYENSVGSIHSHPRNFFWSTRLCGPSKSDVYGWGFNRAYSSEIQIEMIQCDKNQFYIFEHLHDKNTELNFKSLDWATDYAF